MVARLDSKSRLPPEGSGLGSIPSRATHYLKEKDMVRMKMFVLKGLMKITLVTVDQVFRLCARWKQLDSQASLNWLDSLNEVSVRN